MGYGSDYGDQFTQDFGQYNQDYRDNSGGPSYGHGTRRYSPAPGLDYFDEYDNDIDNLLNDIGSKMRFYTFIFLADLPNSQLVTVTSRKNLYNQASLHGPAVPADAPTIRYRYHT